MSQTRGRKYDNVAAIDLLHQVSSMYTGTKKPHDYGTGDTYTSVETHIVKCIADHPGITLTQLAYDYAKTKGAISQILKKLVEKDLILQKPSDEPGDKRVFLYLSPPGRSAERSPHPLRRGARRRDPGPCAEGIHGRGDRHRVRRHPVLAEVQASGA